MNTIFMFLINSILLGAGLAMDAFSVSLADGLNAPKLSRGMVAAIPLTFAGFQFLMPVIGWVCVHSIAEAFASFRKFIPWIALALLLVIGGKMLVEGIRGKAAEEESVAVIKPRTLILQGVATSIDALSVGFTIAEYSAVKAVAAGLIIAVVTFALCFAGVHLGRKFGTKLAGKAEIIGGVILILIGIEIFITSGK